jgi:flagellar FliL protein
MLFVPPDPETPSQNTTEPEEYLDLDSSELEENKAPEKVELDLDDAPFLEEEEEVEETQEAEPSPSVELDTQPEKVEQTKAIPFWKKKWFLILLILIILVAGAIYYFIFRPQVTSSKPKSQPEEVKERQISPPEPPPPPPPEEIIIPFEPFWVELKFKNQTKFLYCKFQFSTTNDKLTWEIKRKQIILRDAIYYYLRNKDFMFLNNEKNGKRLKKDILTVVNQYLNNGQLENILIEEYVLK